MSDRICYLERTDRGLVLTSARMIGSQTDDSWTPSGLGNISSELGSGSPDSIYSAVDDVSVWIKQRLKSSSGSSRTLAALCLDPDGATCAWAKPEESSPEFISSAVEEGSSGAAPNPDELDEGYHSTISERFPELPLEMSIDALEGDQTSEGARNAVIATPDAPARLILDELDGLGIRVGKVVHLWSVIAQAWDPGSSTNESNNPTKHFDRVISTEEPVCASLVLDPQRARIIWTWSKEGELICAGTQRVKLQSEGIELDRADISRLCIDWIGWASQLGVAPTRIVMVSPTEGCGMDPSAISSMFSIHWPTATIDFKNHDDPILTTLRSVLDSDGRMSDDIQSAPLTHRPGRSHRSMYRWAAAALILASGVIAWTGWGMHTRASKLQDRSRTIKNDMAVLVNTVDPPLSMPAYPDRELQDRLRGLINKSSPVEAYQTKPILEELETISYVIGMSGIEIDMIQLTNTLVKLKIRVDADDLGTGEQIREAIQSIDGTHIDWSGTPQFVKKGNLIEATFTGQWKRGEQS